MNKSQTPKEQGQTKDNDTEKLCKTQSQDDEIGKAYAALDKMYELLSCGEKRIELSAAKEILGLLGVPDSSAEEARANKLEVEIKII